MESTTSMHWTHSRTDSYAGATRRCSDAQQRVAGQRDPRSRCVCLPAAGRRRRAAVGGSALTALTERLGLRNEFDPGDPPARESFALLRRQAATPADIADEGILGADWIIHVASKRGEVVDELCEGVTKLLAPVARARVLRGVVRPKNYTGAAMNNWAYGHAVVQQPGAAMPNAFLCPMSKTAEWWRKDWMERHTYFLPRYDEQGRMVSEGHALATAAGIPCLLRRTYKSVTEPAAEGDYDFVSYFECNDEAIPDVPPGVRRAARRRSATRNGASCARDRRGMDVGSRPGRSCSCARRKRLEPCG